MAQDVFSKMAEEYCLLKEDGYLNADTDLKKIIYHPSLNVILICRKSGVVLVLDVNSGVVLQSSYLSAQNQSNVTCGYIPGYDRVFFCDGQAIGVRSDYSGVLLLDSILQKPITSCKDDVKVELLLSEAIILKQSLNSINGSTLNLLQNELTIKIAEAQKQSKKGIKAQKWNTVCLEFSLELLRSLTNSIVTELVAKNEHTPELGIASAIYERLSELMSEQGNASDRRAMASEAKRRETFTQWPHMDYKWALPDQMAQAGFYHQPNASGDDRAMCFTCTVCLVCWERTDEPWSEHERHSPNCPFVMGEYTQNVPLSVTYATNPAIDATYRGVPVNIIGTSNVPHLLSTANKDGLISVFDVSGKLKQTHFFFVTQFDSHILERLTEDVGVSGVWNNDEVKYPIEKKITSLSVVGEKVKNSTNAISQSIRPSIICGLSIKCQVSFKSSLIEALNDQNKNDLCSVNIMEVDEIPSYNSEFSGLYLVVYDFQYSKEQPDSEVKADAEVAVVNKRKENPDPGNKFEKDWNYIFNIPGGSMFDGNMDIGSNDSDECAFMQNKDFDLDHYKQQLMYQALIPPEATEKLFLPPTPPHSGPRAVHIQTTETDSAEASSLIIPPPDYSFMNGQLSGSPVETVATSEKSISDHIVDLKNSKSKKLNYSRAVQCISVPEQYKNRRDLEISDIIPTHDGRHVLVVLKSIFDKTSVLVLYSLNFSAKMVKMNDEPILFRELTQYEKPVEVSLLSQIERLNESPQNSHKSARGTAIVVCQDGAVRLVDLSTLKITSVAKLNGEKFISATYCNSLERLCASTEKGSLHFYALNDSDGDLVEDHEDEDLVGLANDCTNVSSQSADSLENSDLARCFHSPPEPIGLMELKRLHELCSFEPLKAGYCAVVPPCWSEMQQAQRQRRHPQHLNSDTDQHIKTWRLQTDTTTYDEHIFEITLPSPVSIGHVDVHFSLHTTVTPHIELTLLKQNTNGIGHRRDFISFAVDDSIGFDALQCEENPITSQEYLHAHNADILAGPVDMASCLDLTEQAGCVTLTSPKLFKARNRTLLLHVKFVAPKGGDNAKSSNSSLKSKRAGAENRAPGSTVEKLTQPGSRKSEFRGCDCLHELSVTVHISKRTEVPHERSLRSTMLESGAFVQALAYSVTGDTAKEVWSMGLDLLVWVASIRMTRNRSSNGEAPSQQIEFLKIIEANLPTLLRRCLLQAGRSIGHKCVKLLIIATNGAKNINSTIGKQFNCCVVTALLEILDSIGQINSSGSLYWLVLLLFKVAHTQHLPAIMSRCISLLNNLSDELCKHINPYHLLLRSRYGLYGTPLEPELFDIEPPPPIKATSIAVTYASVVSGESLPQPTDFHTTYGCNKETLDPKDVLSSHGEGKMKLKNVASSKLIHGLVESEPLHFTCTSASDGTRVERADITGTNYVNNIIPIVATTSPQPHNSGTKKVEIEHHYGTDSPKIIYHVNNKNLSEQQGTSSSHDWLDGVFQVILDADHGKAVKDHLEILVDPIFTTAQTENKIKAAFRADEILAPQLTLPWQQLLVMPPQQVIVVERMHSGARRYVTLDFGQPVLLTDVIIPSCYDLVSISLDLWVKSEEIDGMRLVAASDIGTKNLVLNDLQPPPLCRYMKITTVGRYGMSTTRCRIPIGYFYGHLVVLPEDVPLDQIQHCTPVTSNDLENQLNYLSMLFEDVNCRYSLACSKLKDLLHPFLTSDITNSSHLSTYMNVMRESTSNNSNSENSRIFAAYQEALTYQRQLNTIRNVMCRIENTLNGTTTAQKVNDLSNASTDKLHCIAESLLDIMLSYDATTDIDLATCRKLFQGLCVAQGSRIQLLTATVLVKCCGKQPFWGSFLADTLAEMFSSSYTTKFPQDRVFILLAFLGRKTPDRSLVLDATLRVIAEVLLPLAQNRQPLVAVTVDLPLLGWLLLFLSLQLDLNKGPFQPSRWDWVTGEMNTKVNESNTYNFRKKLHKRFLQYKQQLESLDWTHKVVQSSAQALSALSSHAANLTSKLETALKQQEQVFKKMKHYKLKESSTAKTTDNETAQTSKQTGKRRRETSEISEKPSPVAAPQHLDGHHCSAVAKGLLTLLLAMDHSCSADMFLLSCKVIARLVSASRLRIGQLMNEEQLQKLIRICMESELPWAPHALACLLQDILEVATQHKTTEDTDMDTDPFPPSTSWCSTDVESICENFALDENFIQMSSTPKAAKTTSNTNSNSSSSQLPSVYESDDSELEDFLDDILARGRSLLKKPQKPLPFTSGNSATIDSRLENGVEADAEITLRRLIAITNCNLVDNLNATPPIIETEQEIPSWSSELTRPWEMLPQSSATNRTMLIACFDILFKELRMQTPANIEHTLQLWLALNCLGADEKFDPGTIPFIVLQPDAINSLISAVAWSPGLSLRTWCSALQTLTLACNLLLYSLSSVIVAHQDFVQLFLRLLSGVGLVFSEKGLAGPSLCKALHDLLVRLQMRCDVISPNSAPGAQLKSLLLKVVYQLVQPTGPLAARQGPLDAQCKLIQSMVHLDYNNADLSIAMSIFESTGILVHSFVSNVDRIKCVNIGERLSPTSHSFSGIFASVLGSESNKQDRPVSWDVLLIALLKLLGKLVQTPLPSSRDQSEAMETEPAATSQTDESKAEQIQQDSLRSNPPIPCLADTVLQHHPSIIRLCQSLASCKASSLSMLAHISPPNTVADLGEPGTVGDAVFHLLAALARKASQKELIFEPLLMFLSQTPHLSEPLLWFVLQVLNTQEALRDFLQAGGIRILGQSLVQSSNATNTVSHTGTISMVMQHFGGASVRSDASTAIAASSTIKKQQQATLENNLALVNFAHYATIKCQSSTAQPADILLQAGAATHRRARTPQWSYHFYPEEVHTELTIQLPTAVLLREVHLQPHLSSLATCPSAVALEVSSDGPSRLVPACPPLPTSGMTFIRLHLPMPEVVNCVQLRLYKPRDANNIGLSQIRLLGTSAFGGNVKQPVLDLSEDESHCKYSLGWLRLLHHCFTLSRDKELGKLIIASAAQVPDLLLTCTGLLLVPTHIPGLYLPNLEKVLCALSLYDRQSGLNAVRMLLESRPSICDPFTGVMNLGRGPIVMNTSGVHSACELLYEVCKHQDADTPYRLAVVLEWLHSTAEQSIATNNTSLLSPAYVSCISSILWTANQENVTYNLSAMISVELFNIIYELSTIVDNNIALKYAVDAVLCSLCYIKTELFPLLLQCMDVLVPNLSTDLGASISDDRKDSESMTDDTKQTFETDTEWYGRFVIGELSDLSLSERQLETIALVSRSPPAIQQLLDSGLPKLLNNAILEFCTQSGDSLTPMAKLESITAILKFFAEVSDEKVMRDWLGSKDGSSFWLPLLQCLCKRTTTRKSSLKSESHARLEEVCVRFLSKCSLCHSSNQVLLAKVLCEVISQQRNGISGFMRRLTLQLLLENEKVPVSIKAKEAIYKISFIAHPYVPFHPAFKQTHDQALLYLSTNTTLADILEQHISFSSPATKPPTPTTTTKKDGNNKGDQPSMKSWWGMTVDSDLSMAAGVTAKDKRAKDAKNLATSTPQLKKKRYTAGEGASATEIIEGRTVRSDAMPNEPLPVALSLGQLLRMIESKGMTNDWPCVHLTITSYKSCDDKRHEAVLSQQPFSSALQVFSSMGGLALLAQHLPTVYPETSRAQSADKSSSEHSESDWVKVEGSDDIYEDIEDTPGSSTPSKTNGAPPNVPTHSLTAFGLFLRLPGYAEVLLKDMKKALCLLRLVLGVTDDGEGSDIFQSPEADSLPTLPFEVLRKLYDATPLSTDDGRLLRRISINIGVVHLLLACLDIFTHQTHNNSDKENQKDGKTKDDRGQLYWAKGTGFGTGSTQQSWNVEQALLKQKSEEEHVTVLLQVLASYINPGGEAADELADNVLSPVFYQLLCDSCLLPALSSYLRNDSVLDMARHIPLYKGALQLLRALAVSSQLVNLLLPQKTENGPSVGVLLKNMKTCVDTYASKLRSAESHKTTKRFSQKSSSGKYKSKLGEQLEELERDEGLAQLMPDIQATANLVQAVTDRLADANPDCLREVKLEKPFTPSLEEQYLSFMKKLQFDTFEMITEVPEGGGYKFVISHHFESNARTAGDQSHPARVKRLAQEAVTLATSLPLSCSSSVFVRCDTDRLDIMKVLITGPADTPYANGCFELDVFFPPDYPLQPMMINLETTGHHTVRFNPNLYNDGKVCLSVLNTWHGRPEEKWNAQTSSFLQVLVSIQSLILVPEPYFNEPGYERSRGTPSGTQSSREYNGNICQATVRWAMLEQIVNPCPCFKDVIHAHFYLKRNEIIAQVEGWIKDMESQVTEKRTSRNTNKRASFTSVENFKKIYDQLKEKLFGLKPPEGFEGDGVLNPEGTTEGENSDGKSMVNGLALENEQLEIDTDIDMEKMVNEMCE